MMNKYLVKDTILIKNLYIMTTKLLIIELIKISVKCFDELHINLTFYIQIKFYCFYFNIFNSFKTIYI